MFHAPAAGRVAISAGLTAGMPAFGVKNSCIIELPLKDVNDNILIGDSLLRSDGPGDQTQTSR